MPFRLGPASALVSQLSDLGGLEQLLAGAPSPGALAEVDIERARELLGAGGRAVRSRLSGSSPGSLRDSGLVEQKGGRLRLTPRGLRRLGDQALSDLFTKLAQLPLRPTPDRPARAPATSGPAKQNRTSGATRSTFRSNGPCATRSPGAGPARRSSPHARRFRGRADRGPIALGHRHHARPVAFDADEGQFRCRQENGDGTPRARYRAGSRRTTSGSSASPALPAEIPFRELPEVSWDYDWGTNIQHGLVVAQQATCPPKRHQAGDHGDRWRADRPLASRGGGAGLRLPADTGDRRRHPASRWPAAHATGSG